jgi:hypothetical protein
MTQEDSIRFPLKKPFVFPGSIILFKDREAVIFWKEKLYMNNCTRTVEIIPKKIDIYWNELLEEVGVFIPCNESTQILFMSSRAYNKLKYDIKLITNHRKNLNKFLYNEIKLDEKGLCDIISDFVRI